MDTSLYLPGKELRIEYPSHNRLDVPLEYVSRRIRVLETCDFRDRPLDASGFLSRPLVRRGSLLVHAHDLDLDSPRKFWAEAIRGVTKLDGELPSYRLGIYDPEEPGDLIEWLGRPFRPTVRERLAMRETIANFQSVVRARGGSELALAAFYVEA